TTAHDVQARLGIDAARITVCTPGAPPWAPRVQEPDQGCILFLGSLDSRKNLGILLDAYERLLAPLPTVPPLVLAGRPGDSSKEILDRVTNRPLAGRVETPGYVDPAAREALYRRAIVLVMPSH